MHVACTSRPCASRIRTVATAAQHYVTRFICYCKLKSQLHNSSVISIDPLTQRMMTCTALRPAGSAWASGSGWLEAPPWQRHYSTRGLSHVAISKAALDLRRHRAGLCVAMPVAFALESMGESPVTQRSCNCSIILLRRPHTPWIHCNGNRKAAIT